jgi:dynein heavy chain, axonemal
MIKELGMRKTDDPPMLAMLNFVLNRVRDSLHVVLSFSPVGAKFRERARKFPALFSTCTIDWFLPWPEEALASVARNFISNWTIDTGGKTETIKQLEIHMGRVHQMVTEVCDIYYEKLRRQVFVTPKSYLSFIKMY